MNLIAAPKVAKFQIPFAQAENLLASQRVFPKQFLKRIGNTEVSGCNISFSDFADVFEFQITNVLGDEFSEQIVFTLEYANAFSVDLKLNGFWEIGQEPEFQLLDVDWQLQENGNDPASAFALETFKAILCLSDKIKVEVPVINYWFQVSIPLPLDKISEILQNRKLAYRLMTIEKAFQTSLPFPKRFILSEEVADIAFCYHAIVDKQFEWFSESITVFPFAIEENKKYLPLENTAYHLTFPILNEIRVIFNNPLSLGQFRIDVERAVIENYEQVKAAFDALDGQRVEVRIEPLNGKIKYTALNAPNLPEDAWKIETRKLIDLDEEFNSVFLQKYFRLAALSLENLSEEQKQSITERPELSIKGFD